MFADLFCKWQSIYILDFNLVVECKSKDDGNYDNFVQNVE